MDSEARSENLTGRQPPRQNRSGLIFKSVLALSGLGVLIAYWLFFSYAVKQGQAIEYEGPCLWGAYRIAHGLNPYPLESLSQSPYAVLIYPPVYFYLASIFLHGEPSYLMPRLISMAASLGTAALYYAFLRSLTLSRLASMSGSVLLMSFMAIWLWSAKGRVDALSITLTCLGLYLYGAATKSNKATNLILSAVSLMLATMTKQPSALFVPALALDLLCRKRFKHLLLFCGSYLLCLGSSILAMQAATQGGFLAHMRFASHMPFEWRYLFERLALMASDLPKFLLAGIAALSLLLKNKLRQGQEDNLRLALLMLLTTIPATFYTAGTAYSNVNHFLVALLPLPLIIVLAMEGSRPAQEKSDLWSRLFAFLTGTTLILSSLIIVFLGFAQFAQGPLGKVLNLSTPVKVEDFKNLVQGKAVLCEDAGYNILYGANAEPVDITTFIQVLGLDGPQAVDMLKKVQGRQYAAIVINHKEMDGTRSARQWSRSITDAITENYSLLGQINGNCEAQDVFIPKSSPVLTK